MKKKQNSHHKSKGFTLMEVMIVVAIMGILAAIALPSYLRIIQKNKVVKAARSFEISLTIAQRHAFVSGRRITLCPVDDVTQTNPTCSNWSIFGPNQNNTQAGWIVFRDSNQDGTLDSTEVSFNKSTFDNGNIAMQWTNTVNPKIILTPRNTSGAPGAMRIYSPESSAATLPSWVSSNPPALSNELLEGRVNISSLGNITYEK